MRDLRGLVGWPGAFVDGWGTARKLGQWCYSDLASSLASSGAASTCGTEGTEQGQTCVTNTPPSVQNPPSGGAGGNPRLIGLGLAVLRVVLLVCLCLSIFLCLLGFLVLLLIVHSLFFLRGERTALPPAAWWRTVTLGAGVSYLCCLLGLWFRLGLSRSL